MKKDRYQRISEIFQEASDLKDDARRSFLDRACEGDPELRKQVEVLLAHDFDERKVGDEFTPGMGRELLAGAIGRDSAESEMTCAASQTVPLPEKIGHFRILEKIGEGGMGTVYLAEQDHPRRQVALKVIRPDLFSPGLHKRFRLEADVLGRLQHPGIAQILEAGDIEMDGGRLPYFAMEYVKGVELRRYIKQHDLGVRARLELAARICDAAHHAHLKGIVHRDLKPDNVLVVEASSTMAANGIREFAQLGQPKVLDFGVARATDSDVQVTTMQTDVGKLVGTITYMSPEQVAGDSSLLDTRSDIYAIGTLLYELLAGRPPFDLRKRPIPEAARIIREEEPTRLGSIRTVFRGDIDTIASKALEKDRERRYASAAELAADIRRYLASEPIIAHPPSTLYQLKKFARRHKGLVAGLALSFLILLVGIVSSLRFALQSVEDKELAKKNEERAISSEAAAIRKAHQLKLMAADAMGVADPLRALELLEAVPSEFRGWEWRHLRARFMPHITEYSGEIASEGNLVSDIFDRHLSVTALYPDGTLIAALKDGEGIELKDLASGEIHGKFGDNEGLVLPNLSPDGSRLAAVSRTRQKLIVWNTQTRDQLFETPLVPGDLRDVCFSSDGSLVALCGFKEGAALIESATGRCRFRTAPYPTKVEHAAFSPDGTRLALCGKNWAGRDITRGHYYLCVYSTTGDCLVHREFAPLGAGCETMAFSPDGRHLVVGQSQRMIRILDAKTLEEVDVFYGHNGAVRALAFSRDGKQLASASYDNTIHVWNYASGLTTRVFHAMAFRSKTASLSFDNDGARLAAGSVFGAKLWALNQEASRVLKGHESYVYLVTFSPDGSLIASGGWEDTVRLWDALTGELLATLKTSDARKILSFTPDGSRLIGHQVWDTATGSRLEAPRRPGDDALIAALAGETRGATRELSNLRFARGGAKISYTGECIALSLNRALVASGRESDEISIRDRATFEMLKRIGKHKGRVFAVAFSPDGSKVVSGDEHGVVKVWDVDTGREVASMTGHTNRVFSVNYTPDGSRIVSGGDDSNIIIWDAGTFEKMVVLKGHNSYVHSLCFSPDGTMLASASGDSTIRLWDSVPPAERWRQIQRDQALQREVGLLVDRLFESLSDPLDVADRLRGDSALSSDLRSVAVRVLLKRSAAVRAGKPR